MSCASQLPLNLIVEGDCLEVMKSFPEDCVDLVIIDPFYGSSGRDGSVHLENIHCKSDSIFGNRMSSDSFIWFVRNYSKQLFRITKYDSHCYVFSDWRNFKDVQIAFETNGWELRSLIVWNKKNGMGEYWRSCHEFILFLTKRAPRKLNAGNCFNVLTYDVVRGKKHHPVQKPTALIRFLIEVSSNERDIVFDPFCGSGTTCVASKLLNRQWIGIDIDPEYCRIARKRIANIPEKLGLFVEQEGCDF